MKIFHLSDLHIGIKLLNRDLRENQEYVLEEIIEKAEEENPQVMIIAGDIYDKAIPSADAVEIFNNFIEKVTKRMPELIIMMISGNHDNASRLNCYRNILAKQNVYMIGMPPRTSEEYIEKVVLQDEYGDVNFYLLPFVKPSMIKEITGTDKNGNNLSYNDAMHKLIGREKIDRTGRNILISHQFYLPKDKNPEEVDRMDSEIKSVGNIDVIYTDVLEPFDYAALGHIHKPMKAGSEFYRYCGTPYACSVDEAGQEKGIVVVELEEKGKITTRVLPLKPLHEVKYLEGELKDILRQGCDDYVTVVLTDTEDLDVIDMQDRIRNTFPNLLEIRRKNIRKADYTKEFDPEENLDPFALCCSFLPDLDEQEKELLQDVINTVAGVN